MKQLRFRLLLACAAAALSLGAGKVAAPLQDAGTESACITCHEDQYYLFDTGKWYCVTEAEDRCTNCHKGSADTLDFQAAHVGLVPDPLQDGGDSCRECHTQRTAHHIDEFISLAGYRPSTGDVHHPVGHRSEKALPAPVPPGTAPSVWRWLPVGLAGCWIVYDWLRGEKGMDD